MIIPNRMPHETGRAYALRALKDNIVQMELKPGSMVSENELASLLQISRTPVREALIELSKVNIVEILPQKGSRISLIDFAMVEESFFVRENLECAVIELVCGKADDADLSRLEANLILQRAFRASSSDINATAFLDLDNEFHKILFDIAEKPMAFSMIREMSIHFDRIRGMALVYISVDEVLEQHRRLFAAIKKRDAQRAVYEMGNHLNAFRSHMTNIENTYSEYIKKGL